MVKETIVEQVMSLLTPVFGADNVSASANVVLNFDKETVVSSDFDTPKEDSDNGLVVSMEELYEMAQGDGGAEGTAGTDSNGIGISEYVYEDANIEDFRTISRTINYELNETQTQIEKQQGNIEKISVAVLLNSDTYEEDYAESISNLVSKAIGVENDSISVESMPFKMTEDESDISGIFEEQASLLESLKNKELVKTLIISLTIVVLFLIFFLLLRSMLKGRISPQSQLALQGAGIPGINLEGEDNGQVDVIEELMSPGKSQRIESIEKFIDKDPAAAAQLLRNWLSDDND
jgi:flagellar M-ring protein FliF